jgi:transposase, IS30 family
MGKYYSHLTNQDRDRIAVLKATGKCPGAIARIIGRHRATVARELVLNAPPRHKQYYLGHSAHERARERWQQTHRKVRLNNPIIRDYVTGRLQKGWSPEIIAGRLRIDKPGLCISHEAIYQYIYGSRSDLIGCLVRRHKKRQFRGYSRKHHRAHIPHRTPIAERPASVTNRERLGDWESDSVVSSQSSAALNVLVDRKSRFTVLQKMAQKTAAETVTAIRHSLEVYPAHLRRTITYDNGSENTDHDIINQALGTVSYFCAPYHSWEKGTAENTNGLLRRMFPKETDFNEVSMEAIINAELALNGRPRKCLGYRTPWEVFLEGLRRLC